MFTTVDKMLTHLASKVFTAFMVTFLFVSISPSTFAYETLTGSVTDSETGKPLS